MSPHPLRWLPNALSAGRLATAPALVVCAALHARAGFLVVLAVALATDAVDGAAARAFGATSLRGAKLDSWGDFALYATVPAGVAYLWPEVVAREWPWAAALVASYLVPVAVGFAKFRRLTSYHTVAAKAAAVAVPAATGLLLLGGPSWPFHLAVVLLAASALEEIALTLVLPAWQANVGSLRRVRRALARPPTIAAAPDGFTVRDAGGATVDVRWDQVRRAVGYKRDLYTTDAVMLALELDPPGPALLELSEEWPGFAELFGGMERALGVSPRWYLEIMTPAFEPTPRLLYARPGDAPPAGPAPSA